MMGLMSTLPMRIGWKAKMMVRARRGLSIQHKDCREHDDEEIGV
jgi:hypothetical protein